MTEDELRQYGTQWIEVRLVDGSTLAGRLLLSNPLELEQPSADPDTGPPRITIDPKLVESVRAIPASPETLD